jgi:hypothetical protein
MGKITMNTETLAKFLNEANKVTYANKNAPNPCLPGRQAAGRPYE